jgi:phosphoglycerate dehydrogenase-like enzyme
MRTLTVDHVLFPELVESSVVLSNAKGLFSNSLAEYVLLSCLYFAKDVDRWKQQQTDKQWNKFVIKEVSLYYQHEYSMHASVHRTQAACLLQCNTHIYR